MLKKWSVLLVLLAALLLLVGTVQAANTKYEFNDVEIDGQTVEIEAAVKETKKSAYSVCSYYTDEYGDYLGQHANDVLAGDTDAEVRQFCIDNFENRTSG